MISGILVEKAWVEDPELIKQAARDYFMSFFTKSDVCILDLEGVFFDSVSEVQREFLESWISREEVLIALKSSDGNKAPGPDGFNMNFFKKLWFTVEEEVMGFINEFCENGRLSKGINRTYIALIPKIASPQSFSDYRPISLLNSAYKILSKCLAKRLSTVLPHLISPSQSAFVANRNIMDGIMSEGRSALVIKLDFWKAYDSVSWEYLELIQKSMGFGSKWMNWMKACYSSANMAVLINGSPSKDFPMQRGLRQGDLLSPFLFLLAAEGLSRILDKVAGEGMLNGVEWIKGGDKMTHLQFADDTVLFCQANEEEVQRLKLILYGFEGCSGLKINFGKSLCFGVGLKAEETQFFASLLGCLVGNFPMKYLGLQVGVNPSRVSSWAPILQKFKDKLASWKGVNLSMAGRVVLIKAALCSMPLYYASIYKILIAVALEIEKIQRKFLWGGLEDQKKIHYVKWTTVTKPRKYGGLGIQALREKNQALLTKWWWDLISGRGGQWRRMVLEKYDIKGAYRPSEEASLPVGRVAEKRAAEESPPFADKRKGDDRIVWTYSPDGSFSTSSLMKAAVAIKAKKHNWENLPFHLWCGAAPPKVEMLIWKIFLDSLPTKLALYRRRVLNREDLICALCEEDRESADHLLIHCKWSWKLWSISLKWWGSSWVAPQSVRCLLESWEIGGMSKPAKRIGKILCYATLWSIWEERNRRCFQSQRRSAEEVGELVKARVAWWAKFRNTKCPYSIETIKRCIEEVRENC
ncbi:hypothetical protein QQ045_032826 [Rhodiola kirilowii]